MGGVGWLLRRWEPLRARLFIGSDFGVVPLDQRDLVQSVEQAIAREGVDLEAVAETVAANLLCLQVDDDLYGGILRDQVDEVPDLRAWQRTGEKAGLVAVGAEDVGEARRDDRFETKVAQGPGRVLA